MPPDIAAQGRVSRIAQGLSFVLPLPFRAGLSTRGAKMSVGGANIADRNIITVLAVDMVGSTRHIAACDPDEAQAFLDQWLDHIRSSVERLGGQIVHYAGDGGIAIFGWPTA